MTNKTNENKWEVVMNQLKKPFEPKDIEWRVQTATQTQNGYRVLVLPYIQSRKIMERLDQVLGPNWKDDFECITVNGKQAFRCKISIKVNGEWVTRMDAAEITDIESVKGGHSNAFKRAAVKWGIGRYLYDLPAQWVDVRQQGDIYFSGEFTIRGAKHRIQGYFNRPDVNRLLKQPNQPINNSQAQQQNNQVQQQNRQTRPQNNQVQQQNKINKDTKGQALVHIYTAENTIGFDLKYRMSIFKQANNGVTVNKLENATLEQLRAYYKVLKPIEAICQAEKQYGFERDLMLAYAQTCYQERIEQIENLFFKTDMSKAKQVIKVLSENAPVSQTA